MPPSEDGRGVDLIERSVSVRRGVLTGVSADLVVASSSLLQSILISRVLGPDNRGLYFLTVFGATVTAYVADFGMSVVAIAFAAQRRLLPQIHTTAVAVALASGGLAAAIFLGAGGFWSKDIFKGFDLGLLTILALGVAPMVYVQIGGAVMAGMGEVPTLSAIRIAGAVLAPVATVPVAVLTNGSPRWTAAMWLLVVILVAGSCSVLLVRRGVLFEIPSIQELRTISGFGLRGYVGNLSHYGFLRLDIVFVSALRGSAAVGIYSLASVLAERIWLIGSALYNASAKRIGGALADEGAAYTARLVRALLLLLVPPALVFGGTAFLWIPLLYGHAFERAALPFLLLLPGAVCLAIWYVVALYVISGVRRPGLTSAAQMCVFIVGAPLYYFGIRSWGITGAAIISSIVYAMVLILGLGIYKRLTGIRLRLLLPGRHDVDEARLLIVGSWQQLRTRSRPVEGMDG